MMSHGISLALLSTFIPPCYRPMRPPEGMSQKRTDGEQYFLSSCRIQNGRQNRACIYQDINDLIDSFYFHSSLVLIDFVNGHNLVETNQRKYSVMMIIECGVTWPALARHEPG